MQVLGGGGGGGGGGEGGLNKQTNYMNMPD